MEQKRLGHGKRDAAEAGARRAARRAGLLALALAALTAAGGCAPRAGLGPPPAPVIRAGDCEDPDWMLLGFEDGLRGVAPAARGYALRRAACKLPNDPDDARAYAAGHARGLRRRPAAADAPPARWPLPRIGAHVGLGSGGWTTGGVSIGF
ncbi:DUF2799 domain-containing protein [Oceanicella actignis]|uniref:DUF2799 domain-containing protein n=1 Tax=Oceanicella actignis TaxID=1189325 RepID=UPI0011E891A9|nr:DUF2799 domain-containing protein [Oceanicella actignis]TYO88469.1 hypothetical protein LY05_02129 [Oceanicella actignis]